MKMNEEHNELNPLQKKIFFLIIYYKINFPRTIYIFVSIQNRYLEPQKYFWCNNFISKGR